MEVFQYYKPLILLSKQYNIPHEIIRIIFDNYLKKNIILNIQINSISEKINNQYNFIIYDKINNKRCHDGINIHLHDIPYASDNIEKYRNIIDKTINNNKHILYFSHYCCNNKGIMYKFNDPLNRNHHFLLS